MIEFFTFSWPARLFIIFILGICVLTQTMALVINFYRYELRISRVFENLLEASILCEIIVFSLLYGQVVNGYVNGFVIPTGYEKIRIIVFLLIFIFSIGSSFLTRTLLPLIIIPVTAISLPIIEKFIGEAFPWFFITALIFFLVRSIKICVSSFRALRTSISALSVKNAVDTLHTGVLFSENDGYTLLSNHQMQRSMIAITGKNFRNAREFYEALVSDRYGSRYKKAELDGQVVYLLPDDTAWMVTKTNIQVRTKKYIHISVADVSEIWELTARLQFQNQELRNKSDKLKETIANLHILSKEREIENAKMRAHDILGQRLTVLLNTIQKGRNLDYNLLRSLSRGLLDEIKAEHREIRPYDEIKSIQKIFAAIGIDVSFDGQLPNNLQHACLFVDIAREASTNAVRHAFATQINIKVELIEDEYFLTINNNGYTTSSSVTPGSGIGVMIKKVAELGGSLDIVPHPVFTLSVVLPGGD